MTELVVLGSAGFIGNHICQAFKALGIDRQKSQHTELVYDLSLATPEWFSKNIPAGIPVLFAIGNANVVQSLHEPEMDYDSYVRPLVRFLAGTQQRNPLILISSSAVYSGLKEVPATGFSENSALSSASVYGLHRIEAEMLALNAYKKSPEKLLILRPFSLFGEELRRQVVFDTFKKVKLAKASIPMFGTGFEERDFIHIDSLIPLLRRFITKADMPSVLNLCTGESTSVNTILSSIKSFLKVDTPHEYNQVESLPKILRGQTSELKKYLSINDYTLGTRKEQLFKYWQNQV